MALRIGLEQIGAEIVLLGAKDFAGIVRSTEKDIDRLNNKVSQLDKEASSAFEHLNAVAVASLGATAIALGVITGAIAGIGGASIKAAGDYENSLQIVRGVTLGTQEQIQELDRTITTLASNTRVNMDAAAQAAGELARAGIDIKDQVGGALEAVLNLSIASAGELGLERAAVLTGSALKAFRLEGESASRVVNAITVAAQNSAITFVDLQRSFQQAAPAAALFGLSVEDLSATLGVLGEQGIRGSDAGTALKQAFQQLVKPSKQGLQAMKEFGISLFDATGAARPFRDVIIDLEKSFGDEAIASGKLTEAERGHALAVIFGSDAVRAGIVLSQRGVSAFDEFITAMNDTTRSAESMAKIMQQSLNNQLQILVNNVNILAVKFGSAFIPVLKEAVANAILFARSLIPIADLIRVGISSALGGLALPKDFQEQLNNLVSPEAVAGINGFINLLRFIKSTIEDIVLPALGRMSDAFNNVFGQAFNAQFIEDAFNGIATAVVGIGVIVATIADSFAAFFSSISDITLFRDTLIAIAAIPIIAVAIGIISITVAILGAIGPTLLLAAAISGIALAAIRLSGISDAISNIGESANEIPSEIDQAASDIQNALETPFEDAEGNILDILNNIDNQDIVPDIDLSIVKAGLNDLLIDTEKVVNNINENAIITPTINTTSTASGFDILVSQFNLTIIGMANIFNEWSNLVSSIVNLTVASWRNDFIGFVSFVAIWAAEVAHIIRTTFNILGEQIGNFFQGISAVAATISSSLQAGVVNFTPIEVDTSGFTRITEDITRKIHDVGDAANAVSEKVSLLRIELSGLGGAGDDLKSRLAALKNGAGTTAGSFGELGNKAGGAGKKIKEEALPAINGFIDALEKAVRLQSFIDAFGDAGAKAINALVDAVVSNTDKEGAKAAEALHEFEQLLRKENITNFSELGSDADVAFATALIERSDIAIEAAKNVIARAADAIKAQGTLTQDTFKNAFNLAQVASNLGSEGSKLMDSLKDAIIKGGTDVIKEAGKAAQGLATSFFDKLPIEQAQSFATQLMDGIRDVIRNKTPESIAALQGLISNLNFDAAITKLGNDRARAINEATDKAFEAINKAKDEAQKAISELFSERSLKATFDQTIKDITDFNDKLLTALKNVQEGINKGSQRRHEDADTDLKRTREDADRQDQLLTDIANARKNNSARADAAKGPQTGISISASGSIDDEIKKIRDKFAAESLELDKKRKRENDDLIAKRTQEDLDAKRLKDQAQELSDAKELLDKTVQALKDAEELRQFNKRIKEISDRAQADTEAQNQTLKDVTIEEDKKFANEQLKLEAIRTIADTIFDGLIEDQVTVSNNISAWTQQLKGFGGNISINVTPNTPSDTQNNGTDVNSNGSQGQQVGIQSMALGGFVSGVGPRVIKAHGGEFIMTVEQVAMFERMFQPTSSSISNNRVNNFNVSASYQQVQSPSQISDDLKALIALTS